ncbi:PH domain-containing protein [Candidatus Saccharibacteria bacterium]|nr:PH domain-containing protein [Candidatus Saccharibacteria bacterium]
MDENLAKIRHERSKKDFPGISLEEGEYVEFAFSRAKIILMLILCGTAFGVIVVLLAFLVALLGQDSIDEMGRKFLFIILLALLAAAIIMGMIALTTYRGNKLYVTNRRVIQLVMNSLVSSSTNAIDLESVEDVSFRQDGLLQRILHFGTLRLATVGEETTYTFKHSDISPEDLEAVSKLVTEAKKKAQKDK